MQMLVRVRDAAEQPRERRGAGSGAKSLAMFVVAAIIALSCFASAASAAETYPYSGVSFGPDGVGGSGTFQSLNSIAVDPGSGDIYAYDSGAGAI